MPLFRPLWSPRRLRPCRAPPRLEVLEDRFAPAGFTVDSALSGNFGSHLNGTLAYCIAQANALSGSDTIRFDSTVFGTASGQVRGVTLDAALPVMTDHLTIQGLPALRVVIERSSAAGTPDFRIFQVAGATTVTLEGLELANGVAFNGGGIFNSGALSVVNCLIRDNTATGGNSGGGGIYSDGRLTIQDSHLRGNSADGGNGVGGGLYLFNASGSVSGTTFERNEAKDGGAVMFASETLGTRLDVHNSTFSGNVARSDGGAIHTSADGQGPNNPASLTLSLIHCTLANNTAEVVGGVGGLFNFAQQWASATVELQNTLLANNGTNLGQDLRAGATGEITSLGNNLADDDSDDFLNHPKDLNGADAELGPLRDNGGPAPTHALLPGSAALDVAAFRSDVPRDQRGVARPQGAGADIGAFEDLSFLTEIGGGGQSTAVNTAFGAPITLLLTDAAGNPLPDVNVVFTIADGDATFAGGRTTVTVKTDASGLAKSPTVLAGGTAGTVEVTARVYGTELSASLTVTNVNAAPQVAAGGDEFLNVGTHFVRAGSFTDAEADQFSATYTATVDYGDGPGAQALQLTEDGRFVLSHVYRGEGSFTVVVRVTDSRGAVGTADFSADVLLAGMPLGTAVRAKAAPGTVVTVATTGVTVTLIRAPGGPNKATVIVAVVPSELAGALDPAYTNSDPDVITAAFDVRFLNVGLGDLAIITFQYANDDFDLPKLSYFDRATGRQVVVRANLIVVDRFARAVTFVLDGATVPRLQDLGGTVFTVSVPISIALPVAPPFDLTPLTALLGLRRLSGPAGASAATAGQPSAPGGAALAQFAFAEERGGSLLLSEGGGRDVALSQLAPAEERGGSLLLSERGGRDAVQAAEGFVPDGLPSPLAALIGLQAATATPSLLDALTPEPPAGEGPVPDEEGAEGEPGEGAADEPLDEAFALMGRGGSAAEALLLLAACLPLRAGRREEALQ